MRAKKRSRNMLTRFWGSNTYLIGVYIDCATSILTKIPFKENQAPISRGLILISSSVLLNVGDFHTFRVNASGLVTRDGCNHLDGDCLTDVPDGYGV